MFNKPKYTQAELSNQLQDIRILMQERDRAYGDSRLLAQKDKDQASVRLLEAEQLTKTIAVAQVYYERMLERVAK